jgi:hypothetical protein
MKIRPTRFVLLLLVALAVTPAFAAEPEPVAPTASGLAATGVPAGGTIPDVDINQAELREGAGREVPTLPGFVEPGLRAPNPLMERIKSVTANADVRIAELQDRLSGETNSTTALEIIRAMEQVKVQVERDILAAQATYARQSGREDAALEIEAALAEMTSPRPVPQPVERPAPDAGNR